jgi:uncharacterized protein with gpF-like domain
MIEHPLDIVPLPPGKAIKYLLAKQLHITWDWQDMWQEEHASKFTVAKVTKADILQDIFDALNKSKAEGTPFEQFKKDLVPLLQQKGWWGKQEAVNVESGEVRLVQLGSPRRLQTIFNVNVQTSLQVGHYKAQTDPDVLKARPYWHYSPVMDGKTRPMHRAWIVITLPADSPWWDTHYPPNGWNCRCTVVSMSLREIQRDGLRISDMPAENLLPWTNPKTGKTLYVPEGIDPGWAFNPGKDPVGHALAVAKGSASGMPKQIAWKLLADLGEA